MDSPPPSPSRELQKPGVASSGGGNNTEGTIAILVIVVIVFFLIWSPAIVRRCRLWQRERRGEAGAADRSEHRIPDVYLDAVMMRRLTAMNRNRSLHSHTRRPHGMSESDRREYIANVLFPRRIVITDALSSSSTSPKNNTQVDSKQDLENFFYICQTCTTKPGQQADDDEHCCAHPCAKHSLLFDNISDHYFHKACISEWLVVHEECPCCRHFFLLFVENEQELQLFEGVREGIRSTSQQQQRMETSSPIGSNDYDLEQGIGTVSSTSTEESNHDSSSSNNNHDSQPTAEDLASTPTTTVPSSRSSHDVGDRDSSIHSDQRQPMDPPASVEIPRLGETDLNPPRSFPPRRQATEEIEA